jgi:hypothetical protein
MLETIGDNKQLKIWQKKFDTLAPKVGDVAPDFRLYDANGANPFHLSNFVGKKPVAIIFGSYT